MPTPKRSKIGFCDYSAGDLNFVIGCTPVSAGCANCYARRIYKHFGKDFSKVTIYPEKLDRLARWQPKPPYKRGPGSRPLAFVVDMGDLFHEEVPHYFIQEFLDDVVYERLDIDWLVLTKRPRRMWREIQIWYRRMVVLSNEAYSRWKPLPNLWLGVTIEDEDNLWRIDELLKTPTAVRWVSLEPMLGPIDLRSWTMDGMGHDRHPKYKRYEYGTGAIQWIVVGAESGPNRRPFEIGWAWDVLDQCREAGVACFLKQGSGVGPGALLLDRKGRECKQWPK